MLNNRFTVLVTGSRDWPEHRRVERLLDRLLEKHPDMRIIHGACPRGADHMASIWARDNGVTVKTYPANWAAYNRSAGYKRNKVMVETGHANICIAFIHNNSRGATNCADLAEKFGIRTIRIKSSPVRYY